MTRNGRFGFLGTFWVYVKKAGIKKKMIQILRNL